MAQTPSNRRHEAREAFDPNCSPMELCQYKNPSYIKDWMDGWEEAEEAYYAEQEDDY